MRVTVSSLTSLTSQEQQDVARPCSVCKLRHRQEQDSLYSTAKPTAIIKELQTSTLPEYMFSQCSYSYFHFCH